MSFQDAVEVIKKVRANRRIDKLIPKKIKAKREATARVRKPKLTPQQALALLPKEVKEKLIAELEAQLK